MDFSNFKSIKFSFISAGSRRDFKSKSRHSRIYGRVYGERHDRLVVWSHIKSNIGEGKRYNCGLIAFELVDKFLGKVSNISFLFRFSVLSFLFIYTSSDFFLWRPCK